MLKGILTFSFMSVNFGFNTRVYTQFCKNVCMLFLNILTLWFGGTKGNPRDSLSLLHYFKDLKEAKPKCFQFVLKSRKRISSRLLLYSETYSKYGYILHSQFFPLYRKYQKETKTVIS